MPFSLSGGSVLFCLHRKKKLDSLFYGFWGHYHHYEDFIEVLAKLEPPLDKRFVKIMDEQLDVIPFEFSEMFIDGFKLGARMMAEVFRDE